MGQVESREMENATPEKGLGPREWRYLGIVLVAGLLAHAPFILSTGFFSDESVYTYAGYAILRGNTPYEQIMLPHPPLGYFGMAILVALSQGSLALLRISYLLLFLLIGALTYILFASLRRVGASPFHPLVAAAVLMISPIPYALTTPLEFLLFEIPVLLSLILVVKGLLARSVRHLLGSGMFLAVAMMIWYPAIFVAITVVSFVVVYSIQRFSIREGLKLSSMVVGGGFIAIGVMLGFVAIFSNFNNFVLESITLQSSLRSGFTFMERVRHISLSVEEFLPMIVLGTFGAVDLVRRWQRTGEFLLLLSLWVYLGNFLLLSTVPKIVLSHYFAYLTPFLAYLASDPIETLARRLFYSKRRSGMRINVQSPYDLSKMVISIAMIGIVVLVPLYTAPQASGFLITDRYTLAEHTVGLYVASITGPNDKIWTSEGAIAYFAGRLIEPSNSSRWPLQTEYNDVFNTTYVDGDGVTQKGLGIASPQEFMEGWIMHRTTVLVFIFNQGPIPYPDGLVWNGWTGTTGEGTWVMANYRLNSTFTFPGVDYSYYVWLIN